MASSTAAFGLQMVKLAIQMAPRLVGVVAKYGRERELSLTVGGFGRNKKRVLKV